METSINNQPLASTIVHDINYSEVNSITRAATEHAVSDFSTLTRAERIAANRARTRARLDSVADNAARLDKLQRAAAVTTEDAVQDAYLLALVRAESDADTFAYQRARGIMANERRAAATRKRVEGELKYADRWTPSDPTGEAAISTGTDALLLIADTFTFATTGRRGAAVDYQAMASSINMEDDAALQERVACALHAARPGDLHKRARAAGMSVADLASGAESHRPTMVRGAR